MSARLDNLMRIEMSRGRFLRVLGMGVVAAVGLPKIWEILDYQGDASPTLPSGDEYGAMDYGGIEVHPVSKSFG